MLIKTARFNQLRHDHQTLQQDYAHLEKQAHEKDVQAASLGSLATEVSALYGLTAGKITTPPASAARHAAASRRPPQEPTPRLHQRHLLQVRRRLLLPAHTGHERRRHPPLAGRHPRADPRPHAQPAHARPRSRRLRPLRDDSAEIPTLWPIDGEISSSFGEREDPILGNGEGEFHPGIDIRGPLGTPIHATADGVVTNAGMVNGYGRMVAIDHGHGLSTGYGHMSGFAVTAGQSVTRGQVIGYVGHSGRTTGNHVHYEVRIHGTPVNPHKYLRSTLADLGSPPTPAF